MADAAPTSGLFIFGIFDCLLDRHDERLRLPQSILRQLEFGDQPGLFMSTVAKRLRPKPRRGFSQVRATQAYLRYVEETEREKPRRARGSAAAVGIHE
jgi:hypothetical protein